VRWAEVDMQKIVFNAHYLMYFDTAISVYWRALALPYEQAMEHLGGDLYVKKATLEYHASARYDDQLRIGQRCARIGNSSIQFQGAIFRGDELLVQSEILYVYANPATQTSQPVPPSLREALTGYEDGQSVVEIRLGDWTQLGEAAREVRTEVFVQEQNIPLELEWDAEDASALHAVAFNRLGMPAGSEFLDVISPQYLGDLISWGAIGARTTESQVHRELASGLSAPIGFKNGTDGNIKIATDAIQAAARGHHFLSVHKNGQVAIVQTQGNKDCHVILRGGKTPNYDAGSVAAACQELQAAKLPATLMVDCSHANSSKKHERQIDVAQDIAAQVSGGSRQVFGVMVESHIQDGAQKFTPGKNHPSELVYGQSITDACIGWDDSVGVLQGLSDAVVARRAISR
jgi:YbgC/YbaW family acyl-CoA thioester hydrolase